jgi:hypothetical protein
MIILFTPARPSCNGARAWALCVAKRPVFGGFFGFDMRNPLRCQGFDPKVRKSGLHDSSFSQLWIARFSIVSMAGPSGRDPAEFVAAPGARP